MWIFDTDHVSLVLRGHPKVISRIGQLSTETRTTIITVQEIFNGWIGELNQASTQREVILAQYHQLFRAIDLLNSLPILEFDDRAYDRYETLLAQNQNLRKKRLHFRTMLQL